MPGQLHAGEASCLAIARQRNWLLLTDDKAARRHAAELKVAVFGLIAVSALVNQWLKVSLHTGFAAFTAVALFSGSRPMGIGAAVVALAVAWSRLELRRHTLPEVVGGALLGIGAALLP